MRTLLLLLLGATSLVGAASLIGCTSSTDAEHGTGLGGGGGDAGGAGAEGQSIPGEDATVTVFDGAVFSWASETISRDAEVEFPATGSYDAITLHLSLDCPTGGCDPWDRYATLGVVDPTEKDDNDNNLIELARFITPYGRAAAWDFDLTELRPLLRGKQTLRAFIATYSKGWTLTATIEMKGGVPAREPIFVVPAWKLKYVVLGDPDKPVANAAPPASLTLPRGASSLSLRALITGHGQGNLNNCAEFCKQSHSFSVAGTVQSAVIWRDDCAQNPIQPQKGTWKYNRAGWCPGADVRPWSVELTSSVSAAILAGETPLDLEYGVGKDYENTCRPAKAESCPEPGFLGCDQGCAYNDGSHTEPYYKLSALLIGYR